jgi:hypothetical protein
MAVLVGLPKLRNAIDLIDHEDSASLARARAILERLVHDDARMDAAYVELARVAMKTNWDRKACIRRRS